MATAIVTLLVAIVPFVIWLIKRRITTNASPTEQNRQRYEEIDADIAARDSAAATAHASVDLDELERLQRNAGDGDQR